MRVAEMSNHFCHPNHMSKTAMKPYILFSLLLASLLGSCQEINENSNSQSNPDDVTFISVSPDGHSSSCAYWTKDQFDRPALCWSETALGQEANQLYFATLNPKSGTLSPAMVVPGTKGMQAHKESMAKIGFKSDGTIVAVFRRSTPTPTNRFAGSVFTTFSTNMGEHWSEPRKLVQDSSSQSQSFFDLERLPNGELGLVWLDSRKLLPEKDGSTLYFASTDDSHSFNNEYPVDGTTCQCCRTDLYLDANDGLHLAFRDILQDSIRDMVHLISKDGGASFSAPQTISNDNWVINGCPHTGPSMASSSNTLACSWYTQGGQRGVYFSHQTHQNTFAKRTLVDSSGAHPQMATVGDFYAIALETLSEDENKSTSQIALYKTQNGDVFERTIVSDPNQDAYNPVLYGLENGEIALAWTQTRDSVQEVVFRKYRP